MSATFDATARAYLLGELADERMTLFEESLLTNPDTLDQVEDIEHDLVEDYVDGRLSPSERRRFDQHYLASAVHRDRVAFIRALRHLPDATPQTPQTVRMWPRAVVWAAAATILVTVAGWWLRQPTPAGAPPVTAPHVAEAPATAPPAPEPTRIAILLAPVITRSGSETPRLVVPDGTGLIDLHLQGDPKRLSRAAVDIRTVDDRPVWSATAPVPAARPDAVTVTLPADRLAADDYILTLADANGQPLARYFFRVARDR